MHAHAVTGVAKRGWGRKEPEAESVSSWELAPAREEGTSHNSRSGAVGGRGWGELGKIEFRGKLRVRGNSSLQFAASDLEFNAGYPQGLIPSLSAISCSNAWPRTSFNEPAIVGASARSTKFSGPQVGKSGKPLGHFEYGPLTFSRISQGVTASGSPRLKYPLRLKDELRFPDGEPWASASLQLTRKKPTFAIFPGLPRIASDCPGLPRIVRDHYICGRGKRRADVSTLILRRRST
jgi:hypothetical protein